MQAYKLLSATTNGTLRSCMVWKRRSLCRTYAVGQETVFDGAPGMAFRTVAAAQSFLDWNRQDIPRPRLYRCEVEGHPLNGSVFVIPWSDYRRPGNFWRAAFENAWGPWKADNRGEYHALPSGTVLCARITPIEDVTHLLDKGDEEA